MAYFNKKVWKKNLPPPPFGIQRDETTPTKNFENFEANA